MLPEIIHPINEYCFYNKETVMGTYTWIFPGMRLPIDTYLITVESVGSNNHGESYTVYPFFQAEPSFNIEKEFTMYACIL